MTLEPYNALAGLDDFRGMPPPEYRHDQVEEAVQQSPHLFKTMPVPGTTPTKFNCTMKPTQALPRPSEPHDPKTRHGISAAMFSQYDHTQRKPPSCRRADVGGRDRSAALGDDAMDTEGGEDESTSGSTAPGKPHTHFIICDEAVASAINGMQSRWVDRVVDGLPPCEQGKEEKEKATALAGLKWVLNTVAIPGCE